MAPSVPPQNLPPITLHYPVPDTQHLSPSEANAVSWAHAEAQAQALAQRMPASQMPAQVRSQQPPPAVIVVHQQPAQGAEGQAPAVTQDASKAQAQAPAAADGPASTPAQPPEIQAQLQALVRAQARAKADAQAKSQQAEEAQAKAEASLKEAAATQANVLALTAALLQTQDPRHKEAMLQAAHKAQAEYQKLAEAQTESLALAESCRREAEEAQEQSMLLAAALNSLENAQKVAANQGSTAMSQPALDCPGSPVTCLPSATPPASASEFPAPQCATCGLQRYDFHFSTTVCDSCIQAADSRPLGTGAGRSVAQSTSPAASRELRMCHMCGEVKEKTAAFDFSNDVCNSCSTTKESNEGAMMAKTQQEKWQLVTNLFLQCELRWQRWGGDGLTLQEMMDSKKEHLLVPCPRDQPPTCHSCNQRPGLWACPEGLTDFECNQQHWACEQCHSSGFQVHNGPLGGENRVYHQIILRKAFEMADLNGDGVLEFLEYLYLVVAVARRAGDKAAKVSVAGAQYLVKAYDKNATPEGLTFPVLEAVYKRAFGSYAPDLVYLWCKYANGQAHVGMAQYIAILYNACRPESRYLTMAVNPQKLQMVAEARQPKRKTRLTPSQSRLVPDIPQFDERLVKKIKVLGQGGMSVAWLIEYQGHKVVAKCPLPSMGPEAQRDMFQAARIQAAIKNPNVLRVLGVHEYSPSFPTILLEVAAGGDISDWYASEMEPEEKWNAFREIAEALNALHTASPPLVHRDLKGANVFLTADHQCKLADFDLAAQLFPPYYSISGVCGTPGFMAPELLAGHPYDCKADVFSYGSLLYEISHRTFPFAKDLEENPNMGSEEWFAHSSQLTIQGIRPALNSTVCPAGLRALIRDCWQGNPAQRPTMQQVLGRLQDIRSQFAKAAVAGQSRMLVAKPARSPRTSDTPRIESPRRGRSPRPSSQAESPRVQPLARKGSNSFWGSVVRNLSPRRSSSPVPG